jgi:Flp pilus assembly protein CpaB
VIFKRRFGFSSRLFAGLSVACALIAFVIVRGMEIRIQTSHPLEGKPVQVVIAVVGEARGTTIDPSMLAVEQIPSRFAPTGALTSVQAVSGRVLMSDIDAGEVITGSRLASLQGGPVAELVPPGLVAVSVTAAVTPGDLRSGDRIDVIASFEGGDGHTQTIGSGLQVLRVDAAADTGSGSTLKLDGSGAGQQATLLLLVDPEQAQRISFAQAFGALSVAIDPAAAASGAETP